jgi:hypothetical protein
LLTWSLVISYPATIGRAQKLQAELLKLAHTAAKIFTGNSPGQHFLQRTGRNDADKTREALNYIPARQH